MTIEEILKTEFSADLIEKMKNRMLTSFHKYGPVKDSMTGMKNGKRIAKTLAIPSALARLERYYVSGNKEELVDTINFLMMEYMFPSHKNAHFRDQTSAESPGVVKEQVSICTICDHFEDVHGPHGCTECLKEKPNGDICYCFE